MALVVPAVAAAAWVTAAPAVSAVTVRPVWRGPLGRLRVRRVIPVALAVRVVTVVPVVLAGRPRVTVVPVVLRARVVSAVSAVPVRPVPRVRPRVRSVRPVVSAVTVAPVVSAGPVARAGR